MSLVKRWEALGCGPEGAKGLETFVSKLEGLRDQLSEVRGAPVSDLEARARLYMGLPRDGQLHVDRLPRLSVATYRDMLRECKSWAQLTLRYGVESLGMRSMAPLKLPTKDHTGPKKGQTGAHLAELHNAEIDSRARAQVYVSGLPFHWTFRETKGLIGELSNGDLSVYVTMLPRKGTAIVKLKTDVEAERVIQLLNGKQIGGRVVLAKHDKFAQKTVDSNPQVNLSEAQQRVCQLDDSSSEESSSSAECHILAVETGVLDDSHWANTSLEERLSSQQCQERIVPDIVALCQTSKGVESAEAKSFESNIENFE
ncbi:hypothetical protein Pmar_PMAR000278, partial [Perkinsus marinus ATCC 50983]